ncbi:MAG: hypothetical protein JXN61_17630 [Sedimentisphaerales bacterium]|nr:hypothetical protein [Sedimentisphaerales bacterium]
MAQAILSDIPVGVLSRIAEVESWRKEVYRPIYYVHKWWARRLGSAFRGILLACCLPDTADLAEEYYKLQNHNDIVVFDPFMGSGVTIGEAVKMGCRVIGRDINPVATTLVETFLSKYDMREIRETYERIRENVGEKILSLYKARVNGRKTIALYYFWVKYLPCPECGKRIDLFNKYIFSAHVAPERIPTARAICPKCERINVVDYDDTECCCEHCSYVYNPQAGNIRGAYVRCAQCGYHFKLVNYMKTRESPLDHRMYAKIVWHCGTKAYFPIDDFDRETYKEVRRKYEIVKDRLPDAQIMPGHNTSQALKHNYRYWRQMFNERQLVGIYYLASEIRQLAHPSVKKLFACLLSGVLEFNNLFCSFKGEGSGAVRHMFSHHILKPEVTPFEANIWGTPRSSGSFSTLFKSRIMRALDYKELPFEIMPGSKKNQKIYGVNNTIASKIAEGYAEFQRMQDSAYISCGDSSETDIADRSVDVVVTDPPFFDNVHYSELADFFHVWLGYILQESSQTSTRKKEEVQDTDPGLFAEKLTRVFKECHRVLKDEGVLTFTYHHSRTEGWTTVYEAVRKAGFIVAETYPIKAEMAVSVPIRQAKVPIHLDLIIACRKEGCKPNDPVFDLKRIFPDSQKQASELIDANIRISAGDMKVIYLGRVMTEMSRLHDTEKELTEFKFMIQGSDDILGELMENGKNYRQAKGKEENRSGQLVLFEGSERGLVTA